MKLYVSKNLSVDELQKLTVRPALMPKTVFVNVETILAAVRQRQDSAVREFTEKFDRVTRATIQVQPEEFMLAKQTLAPAIMQALTVAAKNINTFHQAQLVQTPVVETMPGVSCWRERRPIERVGIYIPGGTAPLPSTVLMLAVPAQLAGCRQIIACTPPRLDGSIDPSILMAAQLAGVTAVYAVGGAQAIAAMAYGTETIPKVDKIFGPGNQYVMAAKQLVSVDPNGAAIDLPAGPSEILVIADDSVDPCVVAADIVSQAEHGADSQSVLVCTSQVVAEKIIAETELLLASSPRFALLSKSLNNSFALVVATVAEAFDFSNAYAPEHLIINVRQARSYINLVKNAGSVFVGPYAGVTVGDYASGTNHTLPTAGYAKAYSGVSVDTFVKNITFQELTVEGAQTIGPTVVTLAEAEGLEGHAYAMKVRLNQINK